jgi:hypothetical protein
MVFSCIIQTCSNTSINPDSYTLKWRRLPPKQIELNELKQYLKLPLDLHSIHPHRYKQVRIFSQCMRLCQTRHRKPPLVRATVSSDVAHYLMKAELRNCIEHDHNYCSPHEVDSSMLSIVRSGSITTSTVVPKPEAPLMQPFCVEMFANNDDAISFYTSFPS